MNKKRFFKVLNDFPSLPIDVEKEFLDEIDVGPDEVLKETRRVHINSQRLDTDNKHNSSEFIEMIHFLPRLGEKY